MALDSPFELAKPMPAGSTILTFMPASSLDMMLLTTPALTATSFVWVTSALTSARIGLPWDIAASNTVSTRSSSIMSSSLAG
jgi:hypothetical protein